MPGTELQQEAERQATICNACRYCEGICAVFPAIQMQRSFVASDMDYLANLCHSCGACYHDCQFSPPHEFVINLPKTLSALRQESYGRYAWPGFLAPVFQRNGLVIACLTALSVTLFLIGMILMNAPGVPFDAHLSPEGFYALMSHNAMVGLFGPVFLFSLFALFMGLRNFWADANAMRSVEADKTSIWQAMRDAGSLRYLDGGGAGCFNEDDKPSDRRRQYHHLTFYGFMLCFAATSVGTIYHYGFGSVAPYPWWDLPQMLGTIGGIALAIGTGGLLQEKRKRLRDMVEENTLGMDVGFTLMLFLTAVTGLALHFLALTPLLGVLLAVHLGVVFSLFLTMPYGKFVHGLYRFAALCRFAMARRNGLSTAKDKAGTPAGAKASRG